MCPSVGPSIHPLVRPSVTHELKPCKSAVYDQNYYQYGQERILCRVSGLERALRLYHHLLPSHPIDWPQVVFSTASTIATSIPQTNLVSTPDMIQPNVPSTGSGTTADPAPSTTATASLIFSPASTSDISAATETYCTQFKEVGRQLPAREEDGKS